MSWAQEPPRHSHLVFYHCWVFAMNLLWILLQRTTVME